MDFFLDLFRRDMQGILTFSTGVCAVLAALVIVQPNIPRKRRIAVFMLEISSVLVLTSVRICRIYEGVPGTHAYWMAKIFKFCDSFSALLAIFSLNLYIKDLFRHNGGKVNDVPLIFCIVDEILLAALAVLIVAEITGVYYPLDATNHYIRTKERYANYLFPLLAILMLVIGIIIFYKRIPLINRVLLLINLVGIILCSVLQFFVQGIPLGSISTVDSAIILYFFEIYNLGKAVERAHRLEIEMMEKYQKELEITVDERTHDLKIANEKAERLLLNILPEPVAKELTENPGKTISQKYPNATVLFTDIVGFTKMSSGMSAEETVTMLNEMTSLFDERAEREGIEKIKTIGDAYMAVSGLTDDFSNEGAIKMIHFARGLLEDVKKFNESSSRKVQIRVGLNSGNLVAGVIGKTKFIYDVWGDTVNVASRMESSGEPMQIHVSESVYVQARESFNFEGPIPVELKGKGMMNGYFL